jgi:hypothetical protein
MTIQIEHLLHRPVVVLADRNEHSDARDFKD